MWRRHFLLAAMALALAGCVSQPRTDVADAIELCGSVGKLQAANTYYMGEVKSLLVAGKTEQKISYPELTPELRVSAMRSTSHCINLRLGNITPETYDKLMTLEATNAAAAERALTSEQLEALMAKGYKRVADILRQAGVSDAAIAQVATVTKADQPSDPGPRTPAASPEMQVLADINTKVGTLETTLKGVPEEVAKVIGPRPPVAHQAQPLVKVLFASHAATLDATALLALHKSLPKIAPDVELSVVGSADAQGNELGNMELSRLRAQSVAAWLMVHRGVEPRRIHVAARGAQKGAPISPNDRSVTIFMY